VEISLSTNTPIKLGAELLDGSLDFYLAPCNDGNNTPQELGAESVHWDPKPILVYHPGDTPAPIDYKVPEPVPVDVEDPEVIPPEDPKPYICEYPSCEAEIPEAEGVRLEDGETILCADHAEIVEAEVPVPHEDPAESVIEELPQAPAIDDWTLRGARIQYYRDNPGVYETPTPEQLQPYLEGAA
jgi:hypothetical protein